MTQQEYENKIKELQDEMEQLKAMKIEAEQPKRRKPEDNETFWYVGYDGTVYNSDFGFDYEWLYLTGNCFKTKEEAEEYKKQIEYTARYKNYIEEHSEPLDWNDDVQVKWFVFYDNNQNKIDTYMRAMSKSQGVIYASSEQIIWDAIKEIGEDNFKKYVLGVKWQKND